MSPGMRLAMGIAYDATLVFLALGVLFSAVFGAGLLLRQSWSFRLSDRLNGWISTRRAMLVLERPIDVQRPMYRRHRWVGLLIALAATVVIYVLIERYNPAPILAYFAPDVRPAVLSWWLEWFRYFVLMTNVFALAVGIVLMVRPSLLKGFEAWANRSYSARKLTKPLEIMHLGLDRLVQTYPRATGAAILIGSLYALVAVCMLLLAGAR